MMVPWFDAVMSEIGEVELLDCHCHAGRNDPDGSQFSVRELVAGLDVAGARGIVFPLQEPDGYPAANDMVIAAAAASDDRLVAFCRLDPRDDPVAEAER